MIDKSINPVWVGTELRLNAIYSDEDQARIDSINQKMINHGEELFSKIDKIECSDCDKKVKYNVDPTRLALLSQYRELISSITPVGHKS